MTELRRCVCGKDYWPSQACVVPEEYAPSALAFMLATMRTRPEWGQDIPLAADGGVGRTWYEAKEGK